ncbi:hypothetical protein RIF29_12756 [Crotalaria pallida]|uniref:Uncharacterized protein n=1 Tax=Crotalaria pallida TaxID=3830 RepID=A0AAN9INI4_CROPI
MAKTLAEQHEKPSSEKDDQKDRSTKKVKTAEDFLDNMEVSTVEHPVQSPVQDHCPEAIIVKQPGMAVGDSAAVVANTEGVDGMVAVTPGDTGLTNAEKQANEIPSGSSIQEESHGFGPWMIAQRPQRRRFNAKKEGVSSASLGGGSNSFNVLQRDEDDAKEVYDTARDNGGDKRNFISSRNSTRAQNQKKPKQPPSKKLPNQNSKPNKGAAPLALDSLPKTVASLEKVCSVSTNQSNIDATATQEASRIRKQKEDTILRIMSQKQNSAWKQYLNDKLITEDILQQHVHNRSEEELGQIYRILKNENWAAGTSVDGVNKPPNIAPASTGDDLMIIEQPLSSDGSWQGKNVDNNGVQPQVDA